MARILKSAIVVIAVWALLALLVAGGVVLGAHAASRNVLRTALPDSVAETLMGPENPFPLQEEVLGELRSSFYKPIEPDELTDDSIKGMLSGLGDDYTSYFDPDQYEGFKERTSGSYSGVGMSVEMLYGYVTVVSTFEDSPAAKAGLGAGDVILAVDDVDTEDQYLDEVVSRIKGEEGTEVTLKVYDSPTGTRPMPGDTMTGPQLPEGGTTKDVVLLRRNIVVPVLESETLTSEARKIAHIRLITFSEDSAQRLRDAVKQSVEVGGVSAIILDLRHNTGGLLNEAVDVASIFVPEGVIVTTEGLHYPRQEFLARGGAISTDVPLFVLVDGFSASASEIVAGALKDTGRATLVGETTFGKGLVQTILSLSDGGALKVTTAVYFTPAGTDINQLGIAPDVVAPDDPLTEDVDETLQKALSLAG